MNKIQMGKYSEQKACEFLLSKGLSLIEQNYSCRFGEIDLIMHDKNDIVFVEVRSRSRMDYGHASETVNKSKQKKIIKSAIHFLQNKQWLYKVNSRFDIIALQLIADKWHQDWIKNAFSVEY